MDSEAGEEVEGGVVRLGCRRAGDLVGTALFHAEARDLLGQMGCGPAAAARTPVDLDLVTGDEPTPRPIHREIEERSPSDVDTISGKQLAGVRIENQRDRPWWKVEPALFAANAQAGLLGEPVEVGVFAPES